MRFYPALIQQLSKKLSLSVLFLLGMCSSTWAGANMHAQLHTHQITHLDPFGPVTLQSQPSARFRSSTYSTNAYPPQVPVKHCTNDTRINGFGKRCFYLKPQVNLIQQQVYGQLVVHNVNTPAGASSNQGFYRVGKHVHELPKGWARDLHRGDTLSTEYFDRGRVIHRSPQGVVRLKIGDTTIHLKESNRQIIKVINR